MAFQEVRVPGPDRAQIRLRVVVAEDRRVQVARDRQVRSARAQIATGGERRVEDVVRVGPPVAVAVRAPTGPGRRDELHRTDRAVVHRVPVVGAAVGVPDQGEGAAVQARSEDLPHGRTVRGHPAASGLPGLHLADRGQQLPPQATAGRLARQPGLGPPIGQEHARRERGAHRPRPRRPLPGPQRRQRRAVRGVAGHARPVCGGRARHGSQGPCLTRPRCLGRGQRRHRRRRDRRTSDASGPSDSVSCHVAFPSRWTPLVCSTRQSGGSVARIPDPGAA